MISNTQDIWRAVYEKKDGSTPPADEFLILENGDFLLLEDGSKMILQ